ncbi:MAG: ribosome recycling factor [Synergistaceae bacterium]|jgi:ribosome recycling factor|nr:ribosome recycling factor [Synergistaceae bacterium]
MPKAEINEIKDLRVKLDKALEFLRGEYLAIRTGRAHPALVGDIRADYYGNPTPLKQMANITTPEARKIQIVPFDRGSLKAIEKALLASKLGITPQNDGESVRLTLPELTKERRVELVKLVAKKAEESRVVLRNHRRDAVELLKKLEKDSKITEDDLKKFSKDVQDITDEAVKKIEEAFKAKEKEILED